MRYLDHITALNRHDLSGFRPLFVGGREVGWVRHAVAERLAREADLFEVGPFGVALGGAATTPAARGEAVAAALASLVADGAIEPPRGERYAVAERWGAPTLFEIDRAHVPVLGVRAYGVHLNGYVRRADGLHLWIGRRASDRIVAPGKLDNVVAGGQPAGLSVADNLRKECAEEAGFGPDLAGRARAAGFVSYCLETRVGLKPDTLFVYDLEIPETVVPTNQDGEIDAFMLWPAERVLETLRSGWDFKFNVALVLLDFAIRHGLITPDDEPEYEALARGLRHEPLAHPTHPA